MVEQMLPSLCASTSVSALLGPWLLVRFRISLQISMQSCWGFDWSFIGSLDQFGEDWHYKNQIFLFINTCIVLFSFSLIFFCEMSQFSASSLSMCFVDFLLRIFTIFVSPVNGVFKTLCLTLMLLWCTRPAFVFGILLKQLLSRFQWPPNPIEGPVHILLHLLALFDIIGPCSSWNAYFSWFPFIHLCGYLSNAPFST